jgi:hypothetical protein
VIRSSLADWRPMKKECRHARHRYWPPLLVLAASIGTGRLYWYWPPLLVLAASIGTGRL